jgi:protein TonB
MARDHRPDEQDSLFPQGNEPTEGDLSTENPDEIEDNAYSSEAERVRNGDFAYRPVALPGADPEPEPRRGGGTALMIVAAIVVVFLVTYVIYTVYYPAPGPAEQATEREVLTTESPAAADPGDPRTETAAGESGATSADAAAVFQAHTELQEKFQQSEARVAELEAELTTLRNAPAATAAPGETAVPTDNARLASLEEENRRLKADLEDQRRESESAVSRAERLVQRAESRITEQKNRTAAAEGEIETLTTERDNLREEVARLEADLIEQRASYERLSAANTTRMEGESEAVRQLINRHADELERQARITREKEAEIQRLNQLIARLSVTETAAVPPTTSPATSTTTPPPTASADDGLTPPRILTRKEPVYPINARRLRVEGTVLLNVLVGTDGRVREVKVLEADGGKLLSPAAVDAVRQWTFSPATRNGQPVQCWHKVPIRFAL